MEKSVSHTLLPLLKTGHQESEMQHVKPLSLLQDTVNSTDQVFKWKIQSQPLKAEMEPRVHPSYIGISGKVDCLPTSFSLVFFFFEGEEGKKPSPKDMERCLNAGCPTA